MNALLRKAALSFVRAFAASLIAFLTGIAAAPDWTFTRAAAVAAIVGALAAGLRAVQHVLETP